MSDLSSLIARLEKAGEPDRGIDRDIADALGFGPDDSWERPNHRPGIHCMDVGDWTKGNCSRSSERYTSSIDAAVSLAERVLPGASFLMGFRQTDKTIPWARIGNCSTWDNTAPTLAMSICLATLRALQQKGSSNG